MKILVLTRNGIVGPSSRVRFLDYFEYLKARNVELVLAPFFDEEYLQKYYSHQKVSFAYIVKHYFLRIKRLFGASKFDAIWLEYEIFPYMPYWLERLLHLTRKPITVVYDDAVFHRYDQHSNPVFRLLLNKKIARVMRNSYTTIVGNQYLENYANQAGAKRIVRVPTVVDTDIYHVAEQENNYRDDDGKTIRIGWLGTRSTLPYLEALSPVFQNLSKLVPLKVCVMGAPEHRIDGVDVECPPWTVEAQVPFIQSLDIGVMPLPDTPWERGKCGLKLIQYMGCGKPVVGSPVGINSEIINDGVNGFSATTDDEWLDALHKLSQDVELRKRMGVEGRKMAEEQYSIKATGYLIYDALRSCVIEE